MKHTKLIKMILFALVAFLFVQPVISEDDAVNQQATRIGESGKQDFEKLWQVRYFTDYGYERHFGFYGKVWPWRRSDFTIQKLNSPQLPDNVPEIEKVIDLTNMVVKLYNDAIPNDERQATLLTTSTLTDEWKQAETRLKRKYDNNREVCEWELKVVYRTREDQYPFMILADTYYGINYFSPKGKTLLFPGLRIMFDATGKVTFISCFYPPTSEEHVYIYRVTETGSQFLTFTLDDESNQPTPWIRWDKDGNIVEHSTRLMYLKDFDIPFDSDQIQLRDSLPHEFYIPSESTIFKIGGGLP